MLHFSGPLVFLNWLPACSPCDQHGIIPWNYAVFPCLFTKRWLRRTFQHQFLFMSMHACIRFKEHFMDIFHQSPPPHPGTHPLDFQYQHGRDDKHTDSERYSHSNEATIGTIRC
ncbi:hypothetical protein ARMGADRAFT_121320 [Armillaria gallica]|uniref:Secreted protein n=1 Tax=Armillaria gallica TaxID=47427 RepID=A0A2H3DDP3_ARMGA|nr:hypothetical protein ARMGADRAFT_121320 [Armillaria gallica]